MADDGTDDLAIRAYLAELTQAERDYLDSGGRTWRFVRQRLLELYWTASRIARKARAFVSRFFVSPRESAPAWKRADAPAQLSETTLALRPRLLLDITSTLRSGKNTGIQRVAREIARHGWELGALPVAIHDGRLMSYYRQAGAPEIVEIEDGDIFVMADASWNHLDEYPPILEEVRARGGAAIVCLYDILPLVYPAAFPPPITQRFEAWMQQIVLRSDGVIADSRVAAESLRDYISGKGAAPAIPIGWWRLGADFSQAGAGEPSRLAKRIAGGKPYYLSVGTIEPRKGHSIVLDALDMLWAEGVDATYVLVGARGWGMRHFEKRIVRHPEYNRRLFWLDRAGDADLALLYRRARAVALASVAEGFGLPIVEAALYGTPVIATDIAVFREAAGDSAQYFRLLDRDSLAARLRAALIEKPRPPVVESLSWGQSAAQLLAMARNGAFQMLAD